MQKLKCVDKDLRKTDDKLWRIKEKLEQEEKYDDLLEEVELLRKTVAAMQEAEKIYTEVRRNIFSIFELHLQASYSTLTMKYWSFKNAFCIRHTKNAKIYEKRLKKN